MEFKWNTDNLLTNTQSTISALQTSNVSSKQTIPKSNSSVHQNSTLNVPSILTIRKSNSSVHQNQNPSPAPIEPNIRKSVSVDPDGWEWTNDNLLRSNPSSISEYEGDGVDSSVQTPGTPCTSDQEQSVRAYL